MSDLKKEFEKELEKGNVINFKYAESSFGNDHYITNCIFRNLNNSKDHFFSLTGVPDGRGFHVRMNGVKVIPIHHKSFCNMPSWIFNILKLIGLKETSP